MYTIFDATQHNVTQTLEIATNNGGCAAGRFTFFAGVASAGVQIFVAFFGAIRAGPGIFTTGVTVTGSICHILPVIVTNAIATRIFSVVAIEGGRFQFGAVASIPYISDIQDYPLLVNVFFSDENCVLKTNNAIALEKVVVYMLLDWS